MFTKVGGGKGDNAVFVAYFVDIGQPRFEIKCDSDTRIAKKYYFFKKKKP